MIRMLATVGQLPRRTNAANLIVQIVHVVYVYIR